VIDDTEIDDANRTRLLDEIRKWAPDARLLYIAGEHSPQTEAQARRSGANYYLPKPMDAALLARVLHALIRSIG
jgi:DNA-binding NtrC family response regulator